MMEAERAKFERLTSAHLPYSGYLEWILAILAFTICWCSLAGIKLRLKDYGE